MYDEVDGYLCLLFFENVVYVDIDEYVFVCECLL